VGSLVTQDKSTTTDAGSVSSDIRITGTLRNNGHSFEDNDGEGVIDADEVRLLELDPVADIEVSNVTDEDSETESLAEKADASDVKGESEPDGVTTTLSDSDTESKTDTEGVSDTLGVSETVPVTATVSSAE
jgi:hypothetical protein